MRSVSVDIGVFIVAVLGIVALSYGELLRCRAHVLRSFYADSNRKAVGVLICLLKQRTDEYVCICQQTSSLSEVCIRCYPKNSDKKEASKLTLYYSEQLVVDSLAPQRTLLSLPLPIVLFAPWESLCTLILETDTFPLI